MDMTTDAGSEIRTRAGGEAPVRRLAELRTTLLVDAGPGPRIRKSRTTPVPALAGSRTRLG